jgi:hypothetical protein
MGRRIAIRAHIVVGRMGWPICLIHSRLSPQALLAVPSSLRSSAAAERRSVNATGLRTALRRCDLGAELPLLAETCRSICVHSYIACQINGKHRPDKDSNAWRRRRAKLCHPQGANWEAGAVWTRLRPVLLSWRQALASSHTTCGNSLRTAHPMKPADRSANAMIPIKSTAYKYTHGGSCVSSSFISFKCRSLIEHLLV